jgi:two-component sensor histidine kinase
MHQASRILPETGGATTAIAAPPRRAGPLEGWPPGLRLLLLGSVVVPALLLLLWGERSWRLEWARAADEARRNSQLVSEFARGVLDTQRAVLDHVGTLAADDDGPAALAQRLGALNDRLPGVLRLAVFDAEGTIVASSRRQPAALDIGDRGYFRALRDGPAAVQVDRLRLRPDGQDVVLVAARRPGAAFAGVIVSTVPVTAFTDFFGRIAADPRAAASLMRADGRLLVRHRPEAPPIDLPPDVPSRQVIAAGGSAVYEAFAITDRTWRLYGMARVGDLPLYASFGVPRDAVIMTWLQGMALVGALLLATSLACCVAVATAARRMQGAAARAQLAEAERRAEMQDALLRELHHRVKNSLMTVQSLIRLQDGGPDSARTLQGRVIALAQVHDLLHVSGMWSRLELSDFIRTLCARTGFVAPDGRVELWLELEPVEVAVEAAGPLALVVVELVTNALRHAFPDGRAGRVTVSLRREGGRGVLSVRDDGLGLPADVVARRHAGLGLVERLVGQLRGRLELRRGAGTEAVVTFPLGAEPAAVAA